MAAFALSSSDGVGESPLHGFGVFADRPIAPRQLIFQEVPMLRLQSIPNRGDVLVCGFCFRFLGSVALQLGMLSRQVNRLSCGHLSRAALHLGDRPLSDIISCGYQCGEVYCSDRCQAKHWEKCHSLLCTGCVSAEDADVSPLIAFKQYAVSTNEILLMVADVFAEIFSDPVVTAGGDDAMIAAMAFVKPFRSYVHPLWWDAAVAPDGTNPDELTASLREIVSVLSAEFISRLIGMFEQNNVGIRLRSPVEEFVRNLPCASPAVEGVLLATNAIVASMSEEGWDDADDDSDEESCVTGCSSSCGGGAAESAVVEDPRVHDLGCEDRSHCRQLHNIVAEEGSDRLFPPLDGTAFFSKICHMNHSCVPNVRVQYSLLPDVGLVADVVALRNIASGDEFLQSYIDTDLDTSDRQKELRDYGFICTCAKCSGLIE